MLIAAREAIQPETVIVEGEKVVAESAARRKERIKYIRRKLPRDVDKLFGELMDLVPDGTIPPRQRRNIDREIENWLKNVKGRLVNSMKGGGIDIKTESISTTTNEVVDKQEEDDGAGKQEASGSRAAKALKQAKIKAANRAERRNSKKLYNLQ